MTIVGKAIVDKRTKKLLQRVQAGEIAVLWHTDVDLLAAEKIVEKKIRAVINFETTFSGKFYNDGPMFLHSKKIPVLDVTQSFGEISEGDHVHIDSEGRVYANGSLVAKAKIIDDRSIAAAIDKSKNLHSMELEKFVENTLEYVKKENNIVTSDIIIPKLKTNIKGKHVLIVIRGRDHKRDLQALGAYIHEVKPILIGVDGGADTLIEAGYRPDIIIGDMDSITDQGLRSGAEIIVHAYKDGLAPGLDRIKDFGLEYKLFPVIGTSEDAALLLAYEMGADILVAVGTHTNMIDFLEKGRWGMASTFLVRLKVGHILIDAKGVNKLYRSNMKLTHFLAMCFAAGFPLSMIWITSPMFQHLLRLLTLRVKLMLSLI